MANPSLVLEKTEARDSLRKKIRALGDEQRASLSCQISDRIIRWILERGEYRKIGIYAALAGEVDLSSVPYALGDSREFSYPLVVADGLRFFKVEDTSGLRVGSFGILEPDPRIHAPTSPADIDLCLCPGLGFSPNGTRLGRGMGYYDSLLPNLMPEAPLIGVAFGVQIQRSLPSEHHDVPMSHLATESGITPTRATAS